MALSPFEPLAEAHARGDRPAGGGGRASGEARREARRLRRGIVADAGRPRPAGGRPRQRTRPRTGAGGGQRRGGQETGAGGRGDRDRGRPPARRRKAVRPAPKTRGLWRKVECDDWRTLLSPRLQRRRRASSRRIGARRRRQIRGDAPRLRRDRRSAAHRHDGADHRRRTSPKRCGASPRSRRKPSAAPSATGSPGAIPKSRPSPPPRPLAN